MMLSDEISFEIVERVCSFLVLVVAVVATGSAVVATGAAVGTCAHPFFV